MRFHWGHGIALSAFIFVCFISSLVYRSMQEKVDFVTTNYYDKELAYQDHIDSERNSLALEEDLRMDYKSPEGLVEFTYPSGIPAPQLSGEIAFYRPDNSSLDFKVNVQCGANHLQQVRTTNIRKGQWKVMVNWKDGTTPYYFEKIIFVI